MEIRGRIVQALSQQSGTSAAGRAWKKQEFILETFDQYPRKVCFTIFGDKVDQLAPSFANYMQVGSDVTVSCDIESRSFMGRDGVERWSTEVRPWKIEETAQAANAGFAGQVPVAGQFQPQQPVAQPAAMPSFLDPAVAPAAPAPMSAQTGAGSDDLPF